MPISTSAPGLSPAEIMEAHRRLAPRVTHLLAQAPAPRNRGRLMADRSFQLEMADAAWGVFPGLSVAGAYRLKGIADAGLCVAAEGTPEQLAWAAIDLLCERHLTLMAAVTAEDALARAAWLGDMVGDADFEASDECLRLAMKALRRDVHALTCGMLPGTAPDAGGGRPSDKK